LREDKTDVAPKKARKIIIAKHNEDKTYYPTYVKSGFLTLLSVPNVKQRLISAVESVVYDEGKSTGYNALFTVERSAKPPKTPMSRSPENSFIFSVHIVTIRVFPDFDCTL
jgi:hypothetical protein